MSEPRGARSATRRAREGCCATASGECCSTAKREETTCACAAELPRGATRVVPVWRTTSQLTGADRWEHIQARLGVRRGEHRVEPGLYALGQPTPASPVLVTANYRLSFDAVRSSLPGHDAWLLVLDTRGINVWCAAGKGTFGTEELLRRLEAVELGDVVEHRRLILPQLGASGVSAHEVRRRSEFRVEYGPVRAADLPCFLDTGKATPQMRRVTFTLGERLVLAPVEVVHYLVPMVVGAVVLYLLAGVWGAIGAVAAALAGTVLFPALLPWLPTREFTSKGLVLGAVMGLATAALAYQHGADLAAWVRGLRAAGLALGLPQATAYIALNFTGSTPMTSQTGVAAEIRRYIRPLAALAAVGAVCLLVSGIAALLGR